MNLKMLSARLAVLASSVLHTVVEAQSDTFVRGDIVVTASGFEQPREETGQAISVIERERLDSLQSVSIGDALQTIPGIRVASRGSVGSQTSVFIRGANSSQTLVLIDGIRINDVSSPNGAFDFGALLTGNIDRVEVLRGPNSVIWGSQAIGGVINAQTRLPTEAFEVRGKASYGYSNTLDTTINLSGTNGRVAGSIGGGYYSTDGVSALAGGSERDGNRNWSANGRLKVNLADGIAVDFRGYFNDGRIEYDSPFGVGANGLPVSDNRQFLGYIGTNFDLAEGNWRNRLSYSRTDIERVGTDPVAFSFNNFDVEGAIDRYEYHTSFDVIDAVTMVGGVEHERTFASTSFEGAAPDVARNRVTSGFVQAIVRPLGGLTLTGGVRHDNYSDYGGQTTLGGNVAYSPNSGMTMLRATYGEGFRAPTLTEGQPPFGNPTLRPETARNVDIGVEQYLLNRRVQASITYFNRRSTNLIAFSSATFQSENIDRVKTGGVELALAIRPIDRIDIQANYTLTDAVNRSPGTNFGKRLALRPQTIASVTADWQSPWGFSIGASLLVVGDSFDTASNTTRIDGYALAGLRAAVKVIDGVELFGRVDNLFDASYETVAGYGTYGRSAYAGVRGQF